MLDHEAMSKRLKAVRESFPTEAEAAEGLHRLGQIMSGKIQIEERPSMNTDEIWAAKNKMERDINELLDKFQQAAGTSVWVESVNLEHADMIGQMAPIVAAVKVDVRLR